MPESERHPTIIIGAGLSGLYTAWKLHQNNKPFIILEARERCGGRILSPNLHDAEDSCIDLGPAWVWPEFQPRLQQLTTKLNLKLFKQFTDGDMLYEHETKKIERYSDQSAHEASYRVTGGANKIIHTLEQSIPKSNIFLNSQVVAINDSSDNNTIRIQTKQSDKIQEFTASSVILALPPRIIQSTIKISPPLPEHVSQQWKDTPTWMASHCKIIFIYDKPFWREHGLSGEAFSRIGPLSEIYDGSPDNEQYYALTAFVGVSAMQRRQITHSELIEASLAQLQRLFGESSLHTKDIQIKDWSDETFTTTQDDINGIAHHPQYLESTPRHFWNKRLLSAGTETAREHGGYIEGAIESADDALQILG